MSSAVMVIHFESPIQQIIYLGSPSIIIVLADLGRYVELDRNVFMHQDSQEKFFLKNEEKKAN